MKPLPAPIITACVGALAAMILGAPWERVLQLAAICGLFGWSFSKSRKL